MIVDGVEAAYDDDDDDDNDSRLTTRTDHDDSRSVQMQDGRSTKAQKHDPAERRKRNKNKNSHAADRGTRAQPKAASTQSIDCSHPHRREAGRGSLAESALTHYNSLTHPHD